MFPSAPIIFERSGIIAVPDIYDEAAAFMKGEICRIGGLSLTQRALDFCAFPCAARLADIGCGKGATVRCLREAGFEAFGLDSDPGAIAHAGPHCHSGNALNLPYAEADMDGVFFECSLSQMENPLMALTEARRVLKPSGYLIISDLYSRNDSYPQNGSVQLKAPPNRRSWEEQCGAAGFSCLLFEDKSEELKTLISQLLWQYGSSIFKKLCAYDEAALKAARCGYFLLIAQKER